MKTSEIILFENEPMYFVEDSREWYVYRYHENHESGKGEAFDISGIKSISKYERHYHRGVLYLFRESSSPKLERRNENVVIVEGPILDGSVCKILTPHHSDFIFIANSDQNVLIAIDTTNLRVSQQSYE
ncbi:hypothetical protein PMAYCL1PPCAC_08847 [Pristionchus mayeri]|uniref:Uncharacterized protein n=1 Tax=Pristionchus mayeri TaxID=1317129 RepID=A0AAN4ZIH2_9BILA|nr:hypothetical protein PMAYCL1PPCAC_08847 [Pristionchus mayeri]